MSWVPAEGGAADRAFAGGIQVGTSLLPGNWICGYCIPSSVVVSAAMAGAIGGWFAPYIARCRRWLFGFAYRRREREKARNLPGGPFRR